MGTVWYHKGIKDSGRYFVFWDWMAITYAGGRMGPSIKKKKKKSVILENARHRENTAIACKYVCDYLILWEG